MIVSNEGQQLAIGRNGGIVVVFVRASELSFFVIGEIVFKNLRVGVAHGDVHDTVAIGRPADGALGRGRAGQADGVATIGRRGSENFAVRNDRDLFAIGRKSKVGKFSELMMDCGGSGRGTAQRNRYFGGGSGFGVELPNCEAALENDFAAIVADGGPQEPAVAKMRNLARRRFGIKRLTKYVFGAGSVGSIKERFSIGRPHRPALLCVFSNDALVSGVARHRLDPDFGFVYVRMAVT